MTDPLKQLRTINDHTTAAALAIRQGAITNLDTWTGRPEPADHHHANLELDPTTGTPATNNDPDGNPLDYNDPTGDTAGTRPDIHAWARREIDRLLTHIENEMTQVLDHLRMGLSTRQAEEVKAKFPAACKSCARLTDHQNRKLYTPARARGLCDWCDDFDQRFNQWPPTSVLRTHHGGRTVTQRQITRALADQRASRT